ncbi:MAG: hypothetical protein OQJ93_11960 [Ignavibacteriaceae bacterium]|nr:hypothetical protein [Ignavibacteriaceae bacterium]
MKTTQCTQVPIGASGSSHTRAIDLVVVGIPIHSRGGETFSPSQVYFFGMNSPSLNAALDISNK